MDKDAMKNLLEKCSKNIETRSSSPPRLGLSGMPTANLPEFAVNFIPFLIAGIVGRMV
jgi:hypothetical protein